MRVLVAGGTGALGRPLVRQLLERGHEVVGMSRSGAGVELLTELGAEGVVADALAPQAVRGAVADAAPQAVVHALTALPRGGPRTVADLRATDRLRRDGTRNLLDAAVAAGARRFVAESMILVYGDCGHEPATEERDRAGPEATAGMPRRLAAGLQASLAALRSLEDQVFDASREHDLEGVVLRCGLFYGTGTSSDAMAAALARRRLVLPASAPGRLSWIHVEDAAAATVAAIEQATAGAVYNVVDDEPVGVEAFVAAVAKAIDAPPPRRVPTWLARLVAPYPTAMVHTRLQASNARIRNDLMWAPRYPSYREGLAAARPHLTKTKEKP